MGAYINPEKETKEAWLAREGQEIKRPQAIGHKDFSDQMLVVMVDTGAWLAAAVAFDLRELKMLTDQNDERPKRYFLAPKEKLLGVSNLQYYLDGPVRDSWPT